MASSSGAGASGAGDSGATASNAPMRRAPSRSEAASPPPVTSPSPHAGSWSGSAYPAFFRGSAGSSDDIFGEAPTGAAFVIEQSPAARSSKAPSDPPSEFSSWHDDASSLATLAGERVTVNMQRHRMGEHLKSKLESMIRQRFENYLTISSTMQNDIGKLAALECQLRVPSERRRLRISISCNEDGTFLVYTLVGVSELAEDATAASGAGDAGDTSFEDAASGPTGAGAEEAEGKAVEVTSSSVAAAPAATATARAAATAATAATAAVAADPAGRNSRPTGGYPSACAPAAVAAANVPIAPRALCTSGGVDGAGAAGDERADGREFLRQFVEQVNNFGMSGRCHSLTALFHFGYNAWALLGGSRLGGPGQEPPCDIAEEEERPKEEEAHSTPPLAPAMIQKEQQTSVEPLPHMPATAAAEETSADGEETRELLRPKDLRLVLEAAQEALERERYEFAQELCNDGISLARASIARGGTNSSASASSSAAPTLAEADGMTVEFGRLLSLRAGVGVRQHRYDAAIQDAEELISLLPTCAEGYYVQHLALRGKGHGPEAMEALMAALQYEPQNPLFQQAFTSLFEEMSAEGPAAASAEVEGRPPGSGQRPPRRSSAAGPLPRRARGGLGDALSTTTQATHLSSRSTTPTEVSERSRSSSADSPLLSAAER